MINLVEIFGDIVERVSGDVGYEVRYEFGDSGYIRKSLDALKGRSATRYPVVCLYTPFQEEKTDKRYYCSVKLDFMIAVVTTNNYTNRERLEISYKKTLHPIYESFIRNILADKRFDFGYTTIVPHIYVDNFTYGNSDLRASDGNYLTDRIDGIDIRQMELKVKKEQKCMSYETMERLRK
ncbi:MAG: hypothetical protein PUB21_07895 [Bacteroidales bacterium]|nr:hypothetical protein [Bacteroidales bacterium]